MSKNWKDLATDFIWRVIWPLWSEWLIPTVSAALVAWSQTMSGSMPYLTLAGVVWLIVFLVIRELKAHNYYERYERNDIELLPTSEDIKVYQGGGAIRVRIILNVVNFSSRFDFNLENLSVRIDNTADLLALPKTFARSAKGRVEIDGVINQQQKDYLSQLNQQVLLNCQLNGTLGDLRVSKPFTFDGGRVYVSS